jgi:predicted GTPase
MKWTRPFQRDFWRRRGLSRSELAAAREALLRQTPPPTFWLFGKTGSGKSSIVRLLTGLAEIPIGTGFRPTTRQTYLYEFPDDQWPVMRFLDTRGLGESGYDAAADIAQLKTQSQALIVTQRLVDFASQSVLTPLKTLRAVDPDRPVVLALTCLHQAYPQQPHPPYPFHDGLAPANLDPQVARALAEQQRAFGKLVDRIVPVDLTRDDDGYEPPDYGGEQLRSTLLEVLPAAYQTSFRGLTQLLADWEDLHERAAAPYIQAAAGMAAAAALAPLPWVDMPVMAAIQTRMVHSIAEVYHQPARHAACGNCSQRPDSASPRDWAYGN